MSILHTNSLTRIATDRESAASQAGSLRLAYGSRPWLAVAILILSDLAALSFAAAASVLIRHHADARLDPEQYLRLWPVLLLFPFAYAASGLYPGFGSNATGQLRKLTAATSLVYPAFAVTIFLLKDAPTYSRAVFLLAWAHTLFLVPLLRAWIRAGFSRSQWWGHPVVLIGEWQSAQRIAETLQQQPELGLKPAAIYQDPELAAPLASKRVRHVILCMADASRPHALRMFQRCSDLFSHVIVIPDLPGFSSLWVDARDLNGILGLEIHQRLLLPASRLTKRVLDLVFIAMGAPIALPVCGLIALVIKLTSRGPVFYAQRRFGRAGRPFTAWKFRSMVTGANQTLQNYLDSDPVLRQEWHVSQKLKHDPRVTPFGRFLRRTSLDELPQLWNVLRGEMSLVGPRPIVAGEIARYGDDFALYQKVRPGLTGMWQVSGRNNLSYQQRVQCDVYYIRNWSPWLDLYLLARTFSAVVKARGAY